MPNFQSLLAAFLASKQAQPSYLGYYRLAEQQFTDWTQTPTFAQLEDWHQSLSATPHQANKALAFLKAMFTWGIRRGLYQGHNPATGIRQFKTFSRERVLTSEEIQRILEARPKMAPKISTLLLVLLTTGCRLSEALRMRRSDIKFISGDWTQPKTKNGKPHVTSLPTQTRRAILELPGDDMVFEGKKWKPYTPGGAEFAWNKIRRELGLADVRLHDFRRTLASHLYAATKDDYLVKRCLNHANPSVTAIYVRITQAEVAAALQAQADRWLSCASRAAVSNRVAQSYSSPESAGAVQPTLSRAPSGPCAHTASGPH